MKQETKQLTAQGLNQFLSKVFLWMFAGLITTGLTGYLIYASGLVSVFVNPIFFIGCMIAEIAIVINLSRKAMKYSTNKTIAMFIIYSFINGLTLSAIFVIYTGATISLAFFSAASVFGVMGLYGYFTKTDLSAFRSFFMVAIIGIIIASLANFFIGSSLVEYIISLAGVVIFAGLTAYDMQKMKSYYAMTVKNPDLAEDNLAITGALQLYLDFINLFLFILRLLGRRN